MEPESFGEGSAFGRWVTTGRSRSSRRRIGALAHEAQDLGDGDPARPAERERLNVPAGDFVVEVLRAAVQETSRVADLHSDQSVERLDLPWQRLGGHGHYVVVVLEDPDISPPTSVERRALRALRDTLGSEVARHELAIIRRYEVFSLFVNSPADEIYLQDVATEVEAIRTQAAATSASADAWEDAHRVNLAGALTLTAWATARGRPDVAAVRRELIGEPFKPIPVTEIFKWVMRMPDAVGAQTGGCLPEVPVPVPVAYRPGGQLERLHALAVTLSDEYRWSGPADGVALIVADTAPVVQPIMDMSADADRFVTLRIHRASAVQDVAAFYLSARSSAGRYRSPDARTLHAVGWCAARWGNGLTWKALWVRWAEFRGHTQPADGERWRTFRRTVVDAWGRL